MEIERGAVLLTGAATGIGAALAVRLARPGTRLMLHTGSNAEGLAAVAEVSATAGASVATHVADLSVAGAPERLVAATLERFGGIGGIVSNAGYADRTPLAELRGAGLEQAFGSMTVAFSALMQSAEPALRAASEARVVAVSSFVTHRFNVGDRFPGSAVAKAGLETLVKAWAERLAAAGVCVNAVVPGYVRKAQESDAGEEALAARRPGLQHVPLGRVGEPDEIAAVIDFLLSPDSAYVTGQLWHVDGGMTL
ncbi:MAG: SDR family oxidoreductase [Pseudomonadota bacterium]